ncbi:Protein of uncharacterised function (DUF1454) [Escherichia coli]|uniref:Protein of uncharacterized function (DUF1454) n=1 Tax=Escherichia coli TaxID=562 RepID=A0A376LF11_ECOLX|nr:Protein of uncharacterised function (DUF1454) [Escherichia coli]
MKPGCTLFFLLYSALTVTTTAHAQTPDTATTAPYLLAGAPTFDLSISQFREDFNSQNPSLPLNEFRAIDSSPDKANLTRAASKINENLYASTALERGTLKIKSIQMTWLPIQGPGAKSRESESSGIHGSGDPHTHPINDQNTKPEKTAVATNGGEKQTLLHRDRKVHCVYVVADNGEKGLTFAVEPIKLALSESLEGLNK